MTEVFTRIKYEINQPRMEVLTHFAYKITQNKKGSKGMKTYICELVPEELEDLKNDTAIVFSTENGEIEIHVTLSNEESQ